MSAAATEAAIKRLEALFRDVQVQQEVEAVVDPAHVLRVDTRNCHVHGDHGGGVRRGSLGNILHARRDSFGPRRESMPALNLAHLRRRDSGLSQSPALLHPSAFPSMLRKDSLGSSTGSLRRDSTTRRGSLGSTGSLNRRESLGPPVVVLRRDSLGSALKDSNKGLKSILRKDSSVSTGSLNRKESSGTLGVPTVVIREVRRDSIGRRRFSTDSLDAVRRNSWDPGRRGSSGSSGGWDDPIWEENMVNNNNNNNKGYGLRSERHSARKATMLRRPWPPLYRQQQQQPSAPAHQPPPRDRARYNVRPPPTSDWRDYNYAPPPANNKGREYYFMAPMYRDALPPPPAPPQPFNLPPRRMLMMDHRHPSCPCFRSRSMEDVRSELNSDWEDDINNNHLLWEASHNKENRHHKRRSMDNLAVQRLPPPARRKQPGLRSEGGDMNGSTGSNSGRPKFVAVTSLEDVQAVRCAEFHPLGKLYAVGSNSKTLRICSYPKLSDLREEHTTYQPTVLFKRTKHHKGSIYCMAWTPVGDLMATGSNDKTVKLMRFNVDTSNLEGQEVELTMHDGTVRDLCFLEDTSNKSSLLISGGAGDCKIYVTDCATGTPFQALSGHSGHVLSLYNWGGAMFVSGSQDKTVRFWDLRTRGCVNMVTPATAPGNRGSAVAGVCVDPSGRLLVSGHEDSSCVLFDIRGGRNVQCFKPHASDVRSIRFSPSAYYLLTAGYDNKLVLTDLQGDLTMPLPSVVVAQHQDKVISGRWHPTEFSFLSTSADKTATLWALPPV